MKILITGASGFLGGVIMNVAKLRGHDVKTLGRQHSSDINCDLRLHNPIHNTEYDCVIHVAGKAHTLPKNNLEAREFHDVNYRGTENLINSLSKNSINQFVFISSVSVYGLEEGNNISEMYPLKGVTPYAKSKIEAENLLINWAAKNEISLLILRLPLIVGNHPKGNLCKMINAIKSKKYFSVNKGLARKSMVLSEDVANCIFDNLDKSGIFNLTDGCHPSFYELENVIMLKFKVAKIYSIPLIIAKLLGIIGSTIPFSPITRGLIRKMTLNLIFDDTKAQKELNWYPQSVINKFNELDV